MKHVSLREKIEKWRDPATCSAEPRWVGKV